MSATAASSRSTVAGLGSTSRLASCYYEGVPADDVNNEVGATVLRAGSRLMVTGALAVFTTGDTVTRVLVIPELVFTPGRQPAGTGVLVEKGMSLVN